LIYSRVTGRQEVLGQRTAFLSNLSLAVTPGQGPQLAAAMKSLEETYSPEVVYHGGLRVYTTLDAGMQQQAETALQQGISRLESQMDMPRPSEDTVVEDDNGLQGALVAIEVNTGAVKALNIILIYANALIRKSRVGPLIIPGKVLIRAAIS